MLLGIFSIFDPLGHPSCHLTSIPLAATDILFLLCLAPTKPLSTAFSTRSGFPCLPPSLKLLGLGWSLARARGKGHTHAGLLPAATTTMPISFGMSLGGCQASALPRETYFRRAQQVILVPASLRYDLIFQELQLPLSEASQKPSLPGKGKREREPQGFLPLPTRSGQTRTPGFPGGNEEQVLGVRSQQPSPRGTVPLLLQGSSGISPRSPKHLGPLPCSSSFTSRD